VRLSVVSDGAVKIDGHVADPESDAAKGWGGAAVRSDHVVASL
jgi:hypothetical protein